MAGRLENFKYLRNVLFRHLGNGKIYFHNKNMKYSLSYFLSWLETCFCQKWRNCHERWSGNCHGGIEFVYGTQFWFVTAENLYLGRKFRVCITLNLLDLKFIGNTEEAKNFQNIANFEVQIRFHEELQIGRASCRERVYVLV